MTRMPCPMCGHAKCATVETRSAIAAGAVRRRHECVSCKYRFTTYEAWPAPVPGEPLPQTVTRRWQAAMRRRLSGLRFKGVA